MTAMEAGLARCDCPITSTVPSMNVRSKDAALVAQGRCEDSNVERHLGLATGVNASYINRLAILNI
jgi:hypothetical protein